MRNDPPATPTAIPSGARLSVAVLLAINMFNYIDRQVLSATLNKIGTELIGEHDPSLNSKLGFLATAFLLSYMLVSPLFGWLADRMSRWMIVGAGVIAWSLASGGSGLATSYLMLLLTRVFVGIGEAAYGPAAPTILADLYPVERRGSVLAWFYMAIPVGSAIGYAMGGYFATHHHWRWAFYASVPPGIVLGIWAFLMREPRRGAAESGAASSAPARKAQIRDYATFWHTPSYVYNTLGAAAMTFAVGGLAHWMPKFVVEETGGKYSDAEAGFTFGVLTAIAGLTATLIGGWAGDKLRARWSGSYFIVSGVGMLIGCPLFVAALFVPFPAAWALVFLTEFCLFFNTGPSNTILANVTHPTIRAAGFALNIFLIHLFGDAVSPWLVGGIADMCGGHLKAGFHALSAAIFASGVFWLMGAKHLERDTRLAPTRLAP